MKVLLTNYVIYDPDGSIVRAGTCEPEQVATQPLVDGEQILIGEGRPGTHYVKDGEILAYTPEQREARSTFPPYLARWDNTLMGWVDLRDTETVRTNLVQELQSIRDQKLEGGFVWDGSTFQSDTAVSQPRLLGLFTTAVAGGIPPEGYPWRLADNSWRVLSAADAIAVWGAFQAHMAGLFAAFAAHEAAVLAEDDIEVLRSYDTEAGWPV